MCLFPKRIKIKLKNGFETYMDVPCNKCIECLNTRVSDWVFRLNAEYAHCYRAIFVTLTYNDDTVPSKGVSVDDIQKHFKRVRKHLKTFRYYCTAEYGTKTLRPHYHYIAFTNDNVTLNEFYSIIDSCWSKGFINMKPLTKGRIIYCIGYLKGQFTPPGMNKVFSLMSRRPAIGYQMLENAQFVKHCQDTDYKYITNNGHKMHLPRYYKKKLHDVECTPVDIIKVKCAQCMKAYFEKLDYVNKFHCVVDVDFFFDPCNNAILNKDKENFYRYVHEKAVNKDFTLKQKNKKTRRL